MGDGTQTAGHESPAFVMPLIFANPAAAHLVTMVSSGDAMLSATRLTIWRATLSEEMKR